MTEGDNLRALIKGSGLTRAQVGALLYVSFHTIEAWTRPASNRSANPAPRWAVELLAYKTRQPIPPRVDPGPADAAGEGSEPAARRPRSRARPGPAARAAAKS